MKAETYQFNLDGTIDKVKCDVHEYDPSMKKFKSTFVSKEGAHLVKPAGRLNIIFDGIDTAEGIQKRFKNAQDRRKEALYLLAEERIIQKELVYIYRDIKISPEMKQSIIKRVVSTLPDTCISNIPSL